MIIRLVMMAVCVIVLVGVFVRDIDEMVRLA